MIFQKQFKFLNVLLVLPSIYEKSWPVLNFAQNVLFIPDLVHNLMSVSQCTENNNLVNFYENTCTIKKKSDSRLVGRGNKVGKLYVLDCDIRSSCNISSSSSNDSSKLWHRRFCHVGMTNLENMSKHWDHARNLSLATPEDGQKCIEPPSGLV